MEHFDRSLAVKMVHNLLDTAEKVPRKDGEARKRCEYENRQLMHGTMQSPRGSGSWADVVPVREDVVSKTTQMGDYCGAYEKKMFLILETSKSRKHKLCFGSGGLNLRIIDPGLAATRLLLPRGPSGRIPQGAEDKQRKGWMPVFERVARGLRKKLIFIFVKISKSSAPELPFPAPSE